MIEGFPDETKKLNDFEKKVVRVMVPKLKMNVGEIKAVTNREITRSLEGMGYKVSPARLRKIMHHIRVNKLVTNLIATSKGYYRATKKKEVEDYAKSLQQRIDSIAALKNSFNIA